MGYSLNDSIVRVDRFKKTGKWYDTHAIKMDWCYNQPDLHKALEMAIQDAGISTNGFFFVCLEPYHQHSHPIIVHLQD